MKEKVFIIVNTKNQINTAYNISTYLSKNFDFNCAKLFSTEKDMPYTYYLNQNEVILSYKNNALLTCNTYNDNDSLGITIDDYYNNDIFYCDIDLFNNISESMLNNVLVIWIDEPIKNNLSLLNKISNFIINLDNLKYLYFNEKDLDKILDILNNYFNTDDIKLKNKILEENN